MNRSQRAFGAPPKANLVVALAFVILAAMGQVPEARAQTCFVPDRGDGTVDLPPPCEYTSPVTLHEIIDGLPPGTTIQIDPVHRDFFNVVATPGGSLGGEVERFLSTLELRMTGTGDLAGFSRTIHLFVDCEMHTAPRVPGDPVQSFETAVFSLQGDLAGDPDFEFLRITAGESLGLPSPGHATLVRLPSTEFAVDSWFDVSYEIDFAGAVGSPLEGMTGSTTGTVHMVTQQCPCIPTFTTWGMIVLAVLLAILVAIAARRRKLNRETSSPET